MVSKNGMEVNEGNLTLRSELRTSPVSRAKIHQALLSQFSLLVEFLIGKVPVKH